MELKWNFSTHWKLRMEFDQVRLEDSDAHRNHHIICSVMAAVLCGHSHSISRLDYGPHDLVLSVHPRSKQEEQ